MKPDKRESVLEMVAAVKALERSPYVRLALAEESARADLTARLQTLRELEQRGRFLRAGGLTLAALGKEEDLDV